MSKKPSEEILDSIKREIHNSYFEREWAGSQDEWIDYYTKQEENIQKSFTIQAILNYLDKHNPQEISN